MVFKTLRKIKKDLKKTGGENLIKILKEDVDETIDDFTSSNSQTNKNLKAVNNSFFTQINNVTNLDDSLKKESFTQNDKDFLELINQLNQVYVKTDQYLKQSSNS